MAKMSDAAIQLLLQVESSHVNVSYSSGVYGGSWIASPVRGHGKMSNPRSSVGEKLISDGLIDPRGTFVTLTAAGRQRVSELHAQGWDLVTQTGHKPVAVQRTA